MLRFVSRPATRIPTEGCGRYLIVKKIIALCLAAALFLCLTACGGSPSGPSQTEPGATALPAPEETAPGETSKDALSVTASAQTDPEEADPEEAEWPPKPTATPDGQPITEAFMAEDDHSEILEKLWGTKWKLTEGDYYKKDIDPINGAEPHPVSTVTFRRDMTAHFTFSDGYYWDVDTEANYSFTDEHPITFLLPDIVPLVMEFNEDQIESLAFAFDEQGRLWVMYEPEYPLQNFYMGVYEPA